MLWEHGCPTILSFKAWMRMDSRPRVYILSFVPSLP
ncbi:hypothetical protein EVA_16614 [gut metagenome]|uniref:Uncharacterized protein n=1 Tax=gut metagenome TaxID=749906 RepID=J9G700_9ZZZZ